MERLECKPRRPNDLNIRPSKGNPEHILPPQKQYPPTKPHRQPERKPPKPTSKTRG